MTSVSCAAAYTGGEWLWQATPRRGSRSVPGQERFWSTLDTDHYILQKKQSSVQVMG